MEIGLPASSKQRSETSVSASKLGGRPARASAAAGLRPRGGEPAGAASDLSPRHRLTEDGNNFILFFLNQSRARVGRRSSVVGRRASGVGRRQRLRLRMSPLDAQESGSSRIRTSFSRQTNTASRPLPFLLATCHQSLHLYKLARVLRNDLIRKSERLLSTVGANGPICTLD